MSYLKIIHPLTVAESMVAATNVPETDHAAWAVGTTYAAGARVIYAHAIWESLQASNTGKTPSDQPLWWVRVGPTNRWAVFDQSPSSFTSKTASISYTIVPGSIVNAVAVLGVGANTVRVRMQDPVDGIVFDETQGVSGAIEGADWWNYFFGSISPVTDAVFLGLPTYGSASIIIDIDAGAGIASAGVILVGRLRSPALQVRYGMELGITDFSRKERDDFGSVQLVQRGYARRADLQCLAPTAAIDNIIGLLATLRSVPCLWIATETAKTSFVYGWYNDFTVQVAYPKGSYCNLELEGLV